MDIRYEMVPRRQQTADSSSMRTRDIQHLLAVTMRMPCVRRFDLKRDAP